VWNKFLVVALLACVHLNTASEKDLSRVMPGIALKKVHEILHYRQKVGGFKSIYELEAVKGFGMHFVDKYFFQLKDKFCL
jgi:competence ComEA-like helix-hairpin-helix protein